ncbi:MAG: hypothetical protein BWY78_00003 [Alphaproteobacteria bacterium ADurb.Bin438]|nr:MAG: hypothetical protein BWY78_00003 [Alphaproteobacteria bacterium ADurb.Bin438]
MFSKEVIEDFVVKTYGNKARDIYLRKVINFERSFKPDLKKSYGKLVRQFITKDDMKLAFEKKILVEKRKSKNDFDGLLEEITQLAIKEGLTFGALRKACDKIRSLINGADSPDDWNWWHTVYLSCKERSSKNNNIDNFGLKNNEIDFYTRLVNDLVTRFKPE